MTIHYLNLSKIDDDIVKQLSKRKDLYGELGHPKKRETFDATLKEMMIIHPENVSHEILDIKQLEMATQVKIDTIGQYAEFVDNLIRINNAVLAPRGYLNGNGDIEIVTFDILPKILTTRLEPFRQDLTHTEVL